MKLDLPAWLNGARIEGVGSDGGAGLVGYAVIDHTRVARLTWEAETGTLGTSVTLDRSGLRHGLEVEWFGERAGLPRPSYCRAWRHGVLHGPCLTLDFQELPLVVTLFEHGTGIDLFAGSNNAEDPALPHVDRVCEYEEHGGRSPRTVMRLGDLASPSHEIHSHDGAHIERRWDDEGRLKPGFPSFSVAGQTVSQEDYVEACAADPRLPEYRVEDDNPRRAIPAAVFEAVELARQWRAEGFVWETFEAEQREAARTRDEASPPQHNLT